MIKKIFLLSFCFVLFSVTNTSSTIINQPSQEKQIILEQYINESQKEKARTHNSLSIEDDSPVISITVCTIMVILTCVGFYECFCRYEERLSYHKRKNGYD